MVAAQGSDVILARMMALHPKIIDLTLDRVHRLLAALDNPHHALPPVVHIAGTNGKGSTLAYIRAGLEASGARVHAYTSPHLARFHERIRLAGTLISEPDLTAFLDECEQANGGVPITYFEITTVAALLAFSRVPADYLLLEVGLGGRLDATNVVDQPRLTVITPVDLDHQQFLGDTLAEIASEKAGILKPGVPCIVARQHPDARAAIEARAEAVGAPLLIEGQDWQTRQEHGRLVFEDMTGLMDLPLPALLGPHQIANAGTALAAMRQLGVPPEACEGAMRTVQWPARMQRLRHGPMVTQAEASGAELWLDGGHNPAAGMMVAASLATLPPRPTHLVCGMLSTKDVRGYLRPLAEQAVSLTALAIPGEAAAVPAEALAEAARDVGLQATTADRVEDAVQAILADTPQARVLICGSLYLAGQVLREHS